MQRNRKCFYWLIIFIITFNLLLGGCSSATRKGAKTGSSISIVFADGEWESIQVHNRIAGYIAEHGYGYHPTYLAGQTTLLLKALSQGDIDIMMEVWSSDYPEQWQQILKTGKVRELSCNFSAVQGWFVPEYMVEGDAERGIEPLIPELKSVQNLPRYRDIFKLSATTNQGIIFNAPRGWPAEAINQEKLKTYHLSASFKLFPSDSEQDAAATLDQAYERGSAWLGYARDPGIITAGHKLALLREEPFSEEQWKLGRSCSYPESKVMIAAHSSMNEKAPELLDFLQKYATTREQNEEMLLYVKNSGGDKEQAAQHWLQNNPDVWSQWVPEEVAEKIWADLNPGSLNKGVSTIVKPDPAG